MIISFIMALSAAPLLQQPELENAAGAGSYHVYCRGTENSVGRIAEIEVRGSLDLTDDSNPFSVVSKGVPPVAGNFGMFAFGLEQANYPFGNGTLCISPFHPGIHRMAPQTLGEGTVVSSMGDSPDDFSLFSPGSRWNFQFWYRDPDAGGANFNLSDAMHVHFETL